jgi:hypothetical protein
MHPKNATCDPNINVDPGQYDPQKPKKHVGGPIIENRTDFSLPFNEKNPLNYVKPMTVNIYFKQGTPGVGAYDPTLVMPNIPGATSAFCSGVPR